MIWIGRLEMKVSNQSRFGDLLTKFKEDEIKKQLAARLICARQGSSSLFVYRACNSPSRAFLIYHVHILTRIDTSRRQSLDFSGIPSLTNNIDDNETK